MDYYTENRFGYLRQLSLDEKNNMIKDLENDIESMQRTINDKNASSEQKSELYNDIRYNEEIILYLKTILEEKQL